ncbi:Extracellular elastase [Seminavis robusta]|uniref:Extracellular elastase n=1 Tax=Seminavis robusta TaxID=568900 RepID=A0A9N8DK72_9STRA|nr:Extracellular elastase [Seminavis robusta]|eukprot:Sro131_g062170.1 Extracellular elastase (1082) ;mRNA; f:18965-22294
MIPIFTFPFLVLLLLGPAPPISVEANERRPSLLRGEKRGSSADRETSRRLQMAMNGNGGDMKSMMGGGMSRKPRKSVVVKGMNGSLGKINAKLEEGNEEMLMRETEEELKKQLKTHFGGHGKEHVKCVTAEIDEQGGAHLRVKQTILGMEVEGASLMVHVGFNGTLDSINGEFLSDDEESEFLAALENTDITPPAVLLELALQEAGIEEGTWIGQPERAMVRRDGDGSACLAWRQAIQYNVSENSKGDGPQLDWIFADATYSEETLSDGDEEALEELPDVYQNDTDALKFLASSPMHKVLCARHPQYHGTGVPSMETSDCNGQTSSCSLESTLPYDINTADAALNAAHNYAIATYKYFFNTFGRDSLDGQGMTLRSRVNYGQNYNNAFWNGYQVTYGTGDNVNLRALSLDADVVAHELTHGLTSSTSKLRYQGESGALNEAMSDIFGAVVDKQEGATGADVWYIGEDIWLREPGEGFRNMADPASKGDFDYYPTRYVGNGDNGGVHYNSGIGNLAFYLLVTGGMHPGGKTQVVVEGIGFEAAAAIFYWANVDCLTESSSFELARFCTAEVFGGDYTMDVHQAWDAVGVPGGLSQSPKTLQDGVSLTDQYGNDRQQYRLEQIEAGDVVTCSFTADSGDPDLYLSFGSEPGVWPYYEDNACSSYTASAEESCTTFPATELTTLFILVHAWDAVPYTSMEITCSINGGNQALDGLPSSAPTASSSPSTAPSLTPTDAPTGSASQTSTAETFAPSLVPSTVPSLSPSSSPSGSPSVSPTRRPTSPPMLPPVERPPPPPPSGCFSSDTPVSALGRGVILMSELEIGDQVLTVDSNHDVHYEPVYGFAHRHNMESMEFTQIHYAVADSTDEADPDASRSPLEMTDSHLLFISGKVHPIRADAVRVDDQLVIFRPKSNSSSTATVTRVERVLRSDGVFAPLTPSGTIIVHETGILASTYISLQESATEFIELQHGLILPFLPQQSMCHLWMTPYRLACMQKSIFCKGEAYNDKGRSLWVQFGIDVARWVELQSLLVQVLVIGAILVGLSTAAAVEIISESSPASFLATMVVAWLSWRILTRTGVSRPE